MIICPTDEECHQYLVKGMDGQADTICTILSIHPNTLGGFSPVLVECCKTLRPLQQQGGENVTRKTCGGYVRVLAITP